MPAVEPEVVRAFLAKLSIDVGDEASSIHILSLQG